MGYFDTAIMPVLKDEQEAYLRHARAAAPLFKRHGAIRVIEAWADDVPEGKVTSLPMAVKCEKGEIVAISYVEWPDKETRDASLPKVMEAMQKEMPSEQPPFDMKRMVFGGFQSILDE